MELFLITLNNYILIASLLFKLDVTHMIALCAIWKFEEDRLFYLVYEPYNN